MDYLRPVFASLYALFQPVVFPASDPERLTQVFCGVILACFVICLVFGFWKRNALRFSQSATTVLGILGTFIGIALGLKDFDTNNIEQSVPPLLAGLKTAFLTSIVGIGATLTTRTLSVFFPGVDDRPIRQVLEEIATASQHLGNLLREQGEAEKENHRQTLESLESIRASVSGEGDTSMLTQIQKLRTTFTDKQDELIQEFRNFAETMAEANSEALIKAIEKLIEDLNAKINEQLGESFNRFSEAVEKLVDWLSEYKEQMETMIEQFQTTVTAIEQTRDSVAEISERSGVITEAAERLDPILATIRDQNEKMGEHLTKFADIMEVFVGMSERAEELVPMFDEKINELTTNFTKLEETATGAIQQVGESSRQNIALVRAQVEDAGRQQGELVSNLAERLHSQITETFTRTTQEITRLAQTSLHSTEARMKQIDDELGEQLTKVLEEFGRRLASISDRFADDYGPLADELRRVMEMVRELRRGLR